MTGLSKDRYFEDYKIGSEQELGTVSLDEADIIDFATKYDPQDFHVDSQKAMAGPFGGLIASGWHTVAVVMRLLVDQYLSSVSSLGSPGIDELRWLAPVRPGDELTVQIKITNARRSRSKPDRGLVFTTITVFNQNATKVLSMKGVNVVACREKKA